MYSYSVPVCIVYTTTVQTRIWGNQKKIVWIITAAVQGPQRICFLMDKTETKKKQKIVQGQEQALATGLLSQDLKNVQSIQVLTDPQVMTFAKPQMSQLFLCVLTHWMHYVPDLQRAWWARNNVHIHPQGKQPLCETNLVHAVGNDGLASPNHQDSVVVEHHLMAVPETPLLG